MFVSLVFGGASGAVLRATATITAGAMAARLIGIATAPLLSRLYGPEDFGVLAVFTAISALLGPLMTLSYFSAVPLPKTDQIALNVLALSITIMAVFTSLFFAVFYFAAAPILSAFSMEAVLPYWWLMGVALIGGALYELLSMWAVRKKAYALIARTQFSQAVSSAAIKVALGVLGIMPLGLLLGQTAKQSGGIITISRQFLADLRRQKDAVSLRRIRFVALRYRKMPVFKLPSRILAKFSTEGPVLFIAAIFDVHTTGQFGLATMAVALPMALLCRTTSQAYYSEVSALGRKRPEQIRAVTFGVLTRLAVLTAPGALILFVFGADIITIVFGERWVEAGQFVSYFALFVVFKFLAYPAMHILDVFDRQGVDLQLNVQRLVLLSILFLSAWFLSLPSDVTVLMFSITLAGHYAFIVYRCIGCIPGRQDA